MLVSVITAGGTLYFGQKYFPQQLPQPLSQETQVDQPVRFTNYVPPVNSEVTLSDFTTAAKIATPGVVHVKTLSIQKTTQQPMHPLEQLFGERFQREPQPNRPRQGSGSGVIISSDGYILTNNHVIDKADEIEVVTSNNKSYNADVIGIDPNTDLALIKINATELSFIQFGNSDSLEIGSWVLAVGNPFNLASTVTAGIVSAKGRNINILQGNAAIESFIQTDAAVNPGNSGGALVDASGKLVGINTAIASPTGAYSGYSFAVPSNLASKVVKDLKEYGLVQRGYLGVSIRNVDQELAEKLNLEAPEGAYVDKVLEGSAADEAGIKSGDIIYDVNGVNVKSSSKLQETVARYRPGDLVNVKFIRDGEYYTTDITLRNKNQGTELLSKAEVNVLDLLGVEFEDVSKETLKEMGLKHGVRISRIKDGRVRQYTDMQEGFVISHIDNRPIKDVNDLIEIMENKKGGVMIEGKYEGYPGSYYYAFGM